jgi:hypothetical protein
MDEKGAEVKSVVVMRRATRGMHREPPPYILNKPFVVAIVRGGSSIPYFVGFMDKKQWKAPNAPPQVAPPTFPQESQESAVCMDAPPVDSVSRK